MDTTHWRKVTELYDAAAKASAERRASLLDEADPELRREVESLLKDEGRSLDKPPWADIALPETVTQLGPGAQLGPYRIEKPIGAGGMGQVFRATDTRLGRPVAIKTSQAQFSERFEREAKAISSLNHPHVCTLYDVGPNYLVMELVEGETLAERLKRGKLNPQETLKYGGQVASALTAAHASGIIHRDLKPGNIMLSKNGVKVLDFGLAKAMVDETATAAGVVIGTPAYMAPEQRAGIATDARSDIYSLGLVLFEMATGKRWRPEDSAQLAGHPQLAHIIEGCLAQEPDDRWQSLADIRREIEWTERSRLAVAEAAKPEKRWMWMGVGAAAIALVGLLGLWVSRQTSAVPVNPLDGAQFTRFTDFEGAETDAAISRDGRFVAYRSDRDGPVDTWMSQVGTGRFVNMTHGTAPTVQVDNIGFSPDGSELWLAGVIGGARLRMMPISGGSTRAFLSEHSMNVSWSPDGSQLVSQAYDAGDPLTVSDATGANGKQIYIAGAAEHNHFPIWSTDGQWIYFVSGAWDTREMDIWRIRPAGGAPERLTFLRTDIKYPQPIDARTVLFCSPAQDGSGPWLWALNTETKQTQRVSYGLERYTSVEASGDGRRLVATVSNPSANLWSAPLGAGVGHASDIKPFLVPSGRAFAPRYSGQGLFYLSSRGGLDGVSRYRDGQADEVWRGVDGPLQEPAAPSPDGRRLAIILRIQNRRLLHTISSDGGDLQKLTDAIDVTSAAAWSPDGNWIVAGGLNSEGPGLFKIPAKGGVPARLNKGAFSNPVWSPDGAVIAYMNPVAARMGHVQFLNAADGAPIDGPTLQVRIGGERFRFLPHDRQLVYMLDTDSTKQTFWLYDLTTKNNHQIADFDLPGTRTFDITPDGKQIVFDRVRDNSDIVLIDLKKEN